MPGSFFDSNVLLYLASADNSKADRAEQVLSGGGAISVQVLNEVANVARRKMHLTWAETRDFLASIRDLLAVHPVSIETHERGLDLAERYGLSLYDATIAASAVMAGCDSLWSEDLQNGMVIGGTLRVTDPFR